MGSLCRISSCYNVLVWGRINGESELSLAKVFGPFFCTFLDFPRGREATRNQVMALSE